MANSTRIPPTVKRRKETFSQRIKTKIWCDSASPDNPYIAEKSRIHGYDLLDISKQLSFSESIFLNIKGELPSPSQRELLDSILSALSNLGPRHSAVRAVMNAAVSKTRAQNLLPVGMAVLSGEFLGAGEVENSVRFIRKHLNHSASEVAEQLIAEFSPTDKENNVIAPGFGARFNGIDIVAQQLASQLLKLEASDRGLHWGNEFCDTLKSQQLGWLITGLAACCFVDLGFTPKASAGLFQLAAAPGLLAHGLEMSNKPLTDMPFVDDALYIQLEETNDQDS
jgi:citrate synthase